MIGKIVRTPTGKVIRWIAGIGLGLIPDYGPYVTGFGGFVDNFILEKVLPVKGALIFLNESLPSILLDDAE